jgi:hypothetical protein
MSQPLPELHLELSFRDKVGDQFYVPKSGTMTQRSLAEAFNRQIDAIIDSVATQGPTPHKNASEQAIKRKKYEWQIAKIRRILGTQKSRESKPFLDAFTEEVVGNGLLKNKQWAVKKWKAFKKEALQGNNVDYPTQLASLQDDDVLTLAEELLAGANKDVAGANAAARKGNYPAQLAAYSTADGQSPEEEKDFMRLTEQLLDGGSDIFDHVISESREDAAGPAAASAASNNLFNFTMSAEEADQGSGHAAAPEPPERTNSQIIQNLFDMLDAPAPVERQASMPDSQGSLFGGRLDEEWDAHVFDDDM